MQDHRTIPNGLPPPLFHVKQPPLVAMISTSAPDFRHAARLKLSRARSGSRNGSPRSAIATEVSAPPHAPARLREKERPTATVPTPASRLAARVGFLVAAAPHA